MKAREIEIYKARLRTGGKSVEQLNARITAHSKELSQQYRGFSRNAEEIEKDAAVVKSYYDAWDGAVVYLSPTLSLSKGDYALIGWEDDSRAKEAIYLLEQDHCCGTYIDQREEFDSNWDSGDYCPEGVVTFTPEEVEIIEKVARVGE